MQNEAEAEHRAPPSLIEAGFYYEKGNNPVWLRRVVDFRGHEGRVRYVDFTGVGQCDISSLSRWAQLSQFNRKHATSSCVRHPSL